FSLLFVVSPQFILLLNLHSRPLNSVAAAQLSSALSPPPPRPTTIIAMGDHLQQPDEERSGEDNNSGKRKLENTIELAKQKAQEIAARLVSDAAADPKRQRVGGSDASSDPSPWSDSAPPAAAPSYPVSYNTQSSQYGALNSKKIAIPNGKVGVVIGKGGETIKYIQLQSGAKIQITKDQEADPHALTRDVDLSGTQDQMSRAEQLINDVISEAEAGAYSSSGGQGSNIKQSGGEQFSMKVPNDRVGLLIGKGGETIKYMQNTSGARVQIIPLHLPAGDPTTERTVYINGSAEQIEAAKELINEVVNGKRIMNSSGSNAYQQPAYQAPPAYWASGGQQPPMQQHASYGGYQQQPGSHPTPPSYYGNYATQQPAWDQSNASAQPQQQTAGYGYYGQQAQMGAAAPVNPNYGYAQAPGAGSNAYNQGYGQQPPSSYGQGQAPTPEQQKAYAGSGYGQTQPEGTAAVSSQPTTQEASAYNQAAYNNPYWNSSGYPSQAAQAGYDQTGYSYGQGGYAAQPAYGQGVYSGDYGQQPHQEAQPQAANGDSESAGYEVKTNKENNAGDGSSNGVKGNGTSES
ncbi:Far upstream element-binding protein 1, partial [Linum perenne]